MNVQMTTPRYVTRPVVSPITSTILDHATVKVVDHFGLMNNEGLWPSYNCLDMLIPTPMCPDPLVGDSGEFKTFSYAPWIPAFEFAVYGGVQCLAVGLDKADQKSETQRVFEASEHKGIEAALVAVRFQGTDSDAPVQWPNPVNLGPNNAPASSQAVVAVAMLEGYAAANYAGVPTLHMSRAVGTLLEAHGLLVWEGTKAFTKNGSKVAMGGGYDIGVDQSDNEWDIYATGEVYVEMSEQVNIQTQVVPGDGSGVGSDENGLQDNTVLALAERMYRVGVDCFVATARVTL